MGVIKKILISVLFVLTIILITPFYSSAQNEAKTSFTNALNQGKKHLEEEKIGQAIIAFKRALEKEPESAEANKLISLTYIKELEKHILILVDQQDGYQDYLKEVLEALDEIRNLIE